MGKTTRIALIAGGLGFVIPILATMLFSDFNTVMFAITMLISLVLVLSIYVSIKHTLFIDLNGVYDRKPMFKSGLKVAVLMALIHSFGMISNEFVNKETLFEMRISQAEMNLKNFEESGEFSKEDLEKERALFEERKATNDSTPPNLLVFGASRVLFVMVFGALYSFVIPIVLRQSPQLKGINKK